MKLNLDCVRDVILCIEEHTGPRTRCVFVDTFKAESMQQMGMPTMKPADYQINLMEKYDIDEIMYHIKYCSEADLIVVVEGSSSYQQQIADLTPKGHDFLANVRDNKIWAGVKDVAGKVGSKSLDAVAQIASSIITTIIKSHFGLN